VAGVTTGPTPLPELNDVLARLLASVQEILGETLVGGYLQGSFALGAGDMESDCDFVFVLKRDPTPEQLGRLVLLHDEIPTRPGHWTRHLEGSYAIAGELRDLSGLGREWWFVDHGWRSLSRSTHCNAEFTRWILRERGITLAGPPPKTLVDPVPPAAMRARMRADLAELLPGLRTWAPFDMAWTQRYLVSTTARMLYTLDTAEVASKRGALEWAVSRCDPEWTPLLTQAIGDRPLGWDRDQQPRPGSLERSLEFLAYAQHLASATAG
jgi:Domain of unknown function (DUF4111)